VRIGFLGSGDFALAQVEALLEAGHAPALVVTQPPRRRRRRGDAEPTPVHVRADRAGIEVLCPPKVNAPESLARLAAADADLFVVAEYGQILSQALLDIPTLGAVNVHASLLPRWRGATPVQSAILAGDPFTGVTIQRMVRELDAGPVLAADSTPIGPDEETGELLPRLARLGATLLVEVVGRFASGDPPAETPQDDARATVCRRLRPEDAVVDWSRPAVEVARLVRAMAPRPGARAKLERDPQVGLLLRRARVVPGEAPPGEVAGVTGNGFLVGTGGGLLEVVEVVPASRRPMSGRDFANGFRLAAGERLGGGE